MKSTKLLTILVLGLSAVNQVAAEIIYYDDFNGTGNLNGTTPDITTGGAVWVAGDDFDADGTITYDDDSYGDSAYLPFVPEDGYIYTLSATLNATVGRTNGENDWLAIGFTRLNSGPEYRFFNDPGSTDRYPVYWGMTRTDQADENDQTFTGLVTAGVQDTLTMSEDDIAIVLNTIEDTWVVSWYYNGILERTVDVDDAHKSYFNYVAMSNARANGTVDDFMLTRQSGSLVAHWSLNEADYDGNYVDTVAGYIAQPTGEPNFITGVRDEPNGAAMITLSSGWGLSETFAFDATGGFTTCFWVDWNGDWQEMISVDDLGVESRKTETEYIVTNALKADQRWQHVCITYENDELRVYLNGLLKMTESCDMPDANETTIAIGNNSEQQIFNGAIDDIRLYDYALSQTEITQLVTGDENCVQQYSLEYDFSGPYDLPDCTVNFYELAEFSKHWLESCIPECSLEYDFSGPSGLPDNVVNLYDLAEFSKHWLESGW